VLRHPACWLLPALLVAYGWLVAGRLHTPFNWDEVNFFWNGQAVAETGVPYANAGFLGDRGAIGGQYQFGLWHPPLYLYTLGLGIRLFGASETTARGVGVVLMALTAVLVYLLGRQTIPSPARDWGALLAVAIFLASPLVVQSSLVLDIDGTVLTLLLTAWTLLYLRLEDVRGRALPLALAVLAVVFALALWAKLTTPFFLLGVVLVYQTLRRRPLRGLLHVYVVGLGGSALFALTWGLACDALAMPFDMPFEVTWAELHDAVGGDGDLLERLESQALPILAWVSPYLAALYVGAVVARIAAFLRRWRVEPVDFLLGIGTLVCAVYFVKLAAGFPKYHVAMLPFWSVVIAYWLATSWARVPRPALPRGVLLSAAGLGLAFAYAFLAIADSWMAQPKTLERPDALGVGLVAAFLLVEAALLPRPALAAPLAAATLVLYAGWAGSADWYHSWVPYSTNYWYGSMGQREMARVVDDLLTRYHISGPYIGAKEVVAYTRNHFFLDQDTVYWLWGDRGEPFDGHLLGYDIPLVVAWVRDPWVRHIFMERLAGRYEPVAEVNDYLAFVRRPTVAPPVGQDVAAETADADAVLAAGDDDPAASTAAQGPEGPPAAERGAGETDPLATTPASPLSQVLTTSAPAGPPSARTEPSPDPTAIDPADGGTLPCAAC